LREVLCDLRVGGALAGFARRAAQLLDGFVHGAPVAGMALRAHEHAEQFRVDVSRAQRPGDRGDRFVVARHPHQREAEVVGSGTRPGLQHEQRAVRPCCRLMAAGHEEPESGLGEVLGNARGARPCRGNACEAIHLLLDASLATQRDREVEERIGGFRRHAQRIAQDPFALRELVHFHQHGTEHDAPAGILRMVVDRLRRRRKGVIALPLLEQRHHFAGTHLRPFAASQSRASAASVCVPSISTFSST
jgi:hypothetical protein